MILFSAAALFVSDLIGPAMGCLVLGAIAHRRAAIEPVTPALLRESTLWDPPPVDSTQTLTLDPFLAPPDALVPHSAEPPVTATDHQPSTYKVATIAFLAAGVISAIR